MRFILDSERVKQHDVVQDTKPMSTKQKDQKKQSVCCDSL